MTLKESIEVHEAIRVTSTYKSFDGDLDKWEDSFYQVWRYQLTWSFAYQIELCETRSGVYLSMLIKPAYESSVRDLLPELGYRDVKMYPENMGVIEYASNDFLDQYIDVITVE